MGYELHVQRVAEDISEDEWLRFVTDAEDFEFHDEVSATSPSGERVAIGGSLGCWTGHSTVQSVPLLWSHGAVHIAFGDDHAVVAALRVAEALDASVVGDEGESYSEPLDNEPAWEFPDDTEPRPNPVPLTPGRDSAEPGSEDATFGLDGQKPLLDRVLPRFRRKRRS